MKEKIKSGQKHSLNPGPFTNSIDYFYVLYPLFISRSPSSVSHFPFSISCVPNVPNRVIGRTLERQQRKWNRPLWLVLFSQYRSCDNILENCFFQIYSSYSCAYVRIIYEKKRVKFLWDLYWENKIYKLKRSILSSQLSRRTRAETLAWQVTFSMGRTSNISPSW